MKEFIVSYWLEFLFGLAITGLTFCVNHIRKKLNEHEYVKEGMVALLHDRLFQSGMYYLNKGEISVSELQNFEDLYKAYHNLGGNGTGTEIYERVRDLNLIK